MGPRGGTLEVVRRAVRSVVERSPELRGDPVLRRRVAESMVRVSLAAADLLDEERRLTEEIARRRPRGGEAALAQALEAPALAEGQAAGDQHRRTAVNSAAGVLQATRNAIDFPGFVTSLITGVFQAMSTSTIQQLQAYADLLGAVGASTSEFATQNITRERAMEWAAQRFPALTVGPGPDGAPQLTLREEADMPGEEELRRALDATEEEVSTIDDSELEETLLPLVRRKLARERQSMLATMLLMGMNRVVVDEGRIHASMNLQVDARSTAEQTSANRFDSRVTTGASASFGTGMWGASANLQASVGYVTSDEQFSREDIAVRAGLRSSVDVAFHTEPIQLNRMAGAGAIRRIRDRSMVPGAEHQLENLLPADERRTSRPAFEPIPQMPPPPPDPDSQEARDLRRRRDFSATDGGGGAGGGAGGGDGAATPQPAADAAAPSAPPPDAGAEPAETGH